MAGSMPSASSGTIRLGAAPSKPSRTTRSIRGWLLVLQRSQVPAASTARAARTRAGRLANITIRHANTARKGSKACAGRFDGIRPGRIASTLGHGEGGADGAWSLAGRVRTRGAGRARRPCPPRGRLLGAGSGPFQALVPGERPPDRARRGRDAARHLRLSGPDPPPRSAGRPGAALRTRLQPVPGADPVAAGRAARPSSRDVAPLVGPGVARVAPRGFLDTGG